MIFKRGDLVTIRPGSYHGAMAGHQRKIFCDVPGKVYHVKPDNDELVVEIEEYGIYRIPFEKLIGRREKEFSFEF